MLEPQALFQLVVVGSSAGGIEALSILVASLPIPFPLPIVLAQHLDPKRVSHLAEILRRHTTLPVVSVDEHEILEPGTIYVVPSDHHVEITDHDLTLLPDGDGRPTPSVNLLLSTAASVYGEKLIAVILTGTGSDGTAGAQSVHEAGGTVIIQNPATAAYSGMPGSIPPQAVDFVSELADVGSLLGDLISGRTVATVAQENEKLEGELKTFLSQVQELIGIDFSTYKPATILRRLQRRLVATAMPDLAAYALYLTAHPTECEKLVADFLIKVTEFMRDAPVFTYIQEQILPELIEYSRLHTRELRFWSAGCATGEEAYSLAIILSEALGTELTRFNIKIFATDLDSEALTFARHGVYPAKAFAKLSPQLINRYFVPNPAQTHYEVRKALRSLLVFAEHDLGQRAPFPRIDLVLCRNVLIYFNRELQQRALRLFAFALREGSYLVLGRSETVNTLPEFFELADSQQRVYRRQGGGGRPTIQFFGQALAITKPLSSLPLPPGSSKFKTNQTISPDVPERSFSLMQEEAVQNRSTRDNLLLKLPVGVVVVDAHFDIVEINSAARRMLAIHTTALGEDFVHLAQNLPPRELTQAITKTIRHNTVTTLGLVEVPDLTIGQTTFLQLCCYPHPGTAASSVVPAQNRNGAGATTSKNESGIGSRGQDGNSNGAGESKNGVEDNKATVEQALIIITDLTTEVTARRKLEEDNLRQAKLVQELTERLTVLEHTNASLVQSNKEISQANSTLLAAERAELAYSLSEVQRLGAELAEVRQEASQEAQTHAHQMEQLGRANQNLLQANEELTTQYAILRSDNEAYLMHTEEAQAAIEEAETLNEEMQASNEELETLNEELQATVEELNTSNGELARQTAELHKQQQLSEQAELQLKTTLASMSDALVVVNPAGEVLLTNPSYDRVFGGTAPPVLYDEAGEKALPLETGPQARAARGETFKLSFSFTLPDDTRQWWEAIGQPVQMSETSGTAGADSWGLVVLRDITDLSLRHSQEQFVSLVAHELRSPLTSIKGNTQIVEAWLRRLIQAGERSSRDEKMLAGLGKVLGQIERLDRLISDLAEVSQIQNGKFRFQFAPLRLDILLEQMVEVGQHATTEQKVELVGESGPVSIRGDAARLQQVVLNLINNAITHAAKSPRISLSLTRRPDDRAELRVQDWGPGVPANHLPALFSRFYQVMHGQAAAESGGLGLGLFICQQIIQAHDGTIEVESQEGVGTTFIIQLPLLEEKEEEKENLLSAEPAASNK